MHQHHFEFDLASLSDMTPMIKLATPSYSVALLAPVYCWAGRAWRKIDRLSVPISPANQPRGLYDHKLPQCCSILYDLTPQNMTPLDLKTSKQEYLCQRFIYFHITKNSIIHPSAVQWTGSLYLLLRPIPDMDDTLVSGKRFSEKLK